MHARILRATVYRMTSTKLGDTIKRRRERKGMTREELAVAAGLSRQTIMFAEDRDTNSPTIRTLTKIAEALDTTVIGLLRSPRKKATK